MSFRTFTMKCEDCELVQDVMANYVEKYRKLKSIAEDNNMPSRLKNNDWVRCFDCGGYAFRVWSPPNINFVGGGFTRSL